MSVSNFLELLEKWRDNAIDNIRNPPPNHTDEDGTYYKDPYVLAWKQYSIIEKFEFYSGQYQRFLENEPPAWGTIPLKLVGHYESWHPPYYGEECIVNSVAMTGCLEFCPSVDLDAETYESFKGWGYDYYGS